MSEQKLTLSIMVCCLTPGKLGSRPWGSDGGGRRPWGMLGMLYSPSDCI